MAILGSFPRSHTLCRHVREECDQELWRNFNLIPENVDLSDKTHALNHLWDPPPPWDHHQKLKNSKDIGEVSAWSRETRISLIELRPWTTLEISTLSNHHQKLKQLPTTKQSITQRHFSVLSFVCVSVILSCVSSMWRQTKKSAMCLSFTALIVLTRWCEKNGQKLSNTW